MACRAFVITGAMGLQGDKMKDDKHATNAGMVGGVFAPPSCLNIGIRVLICIIMLIP